MPKTRRPHPAEFRAEMVRLATAGGTPGELSRVVRTVRPDHPNWVNQADVDDGRKEGLTTGEREERRWLRRENRILREERGAFWQRQRPGSPRRVRIDPQAYSRIPSRSALAASAAQDRRMLARSTSTAVNPVGTSGASACRSSR